MPVYINRVFPLLQGNHVAKFGQDPVYRTSYCAQMILLSKILFIVTVTFDPKINRVLPLPQGNHAAKFGKDPIYRTKVIVQKPVWTPTIPNHIIRPVSRRAYKNLCQVRSVKGLGTTHVHEVFTFAPKNKFKKWGALKSL